MSKQDDIEKRRDADPEGLAGRTLPSLDLAELERAFGPDGTSATPSRRRTTRLGPDRGVENTSEIEVRSLRPIDAVPVQPPSPSVTRELLLQGPSPSRTDAPPALLPTTFALDRLLEALSEEVIPPELPLYLPPAATHTFDGMMGSTLELKASSFPTTDGERPVGRGDDDLNWLLPAAPDRALLPNSFGLSDEQVTRACVDLYPGVQPPTAETWIALGHIARLEAGIVDRFAQAGQLFAALTDALSTPALEPLRKQLEATGLLNDPDVLQVLRLWKEDRHEPRFWADDDGSRLKAQRLVGAYLFRKRGEQLCQLAQLLTGQLSTLSDLQAVMLELRADWSERQQQVRQRFPAQTATFSATFVVQRGLNARPGFFWMDAEEGEL